jgi:Adenylate and Guanylate cyclase catalytic domain
MPESSLPLKVGLHSGPVTAGVLRGEKSRFQLFGDTVNTAARMESTGLQNRIHVSMETAELLKAAGKHYWLKPREDKIVARGKGELTTYWLDIKQQSSGSCHSGKSGKSQNSDSQHSDIAKVALSSLAAAPEVQIDPIIPAKIRRLVSSQN